MMRQYFQFKQNEELVVPYERNGSKVGESDERAALFIVLDDPFSVVLAEITL
jgi:hypothetical protein